MKIPSLPGPRISLALAILAIAPIVIAGDAPISVGRFKNRRGLDIVEVKEVFKRSDYAKIRVEPFDLSAIEIPGKDDNTYEVVLLAKAKFHERFIGKIRTELHPVPVETTESAMAQTSGAKSGASAPSGDLQTPGTAPAPVATPALEAAKTEATAPRHLLIRGKVTKLDPGSAAGRTFFGMFGGGQARVEITCELVDSASGRVLATLVQARAGTMSGGFGYDRLIQNLCEEVGEDVATLVKQFK